MSPDQSQYEGLKAIHQKDSNLTVYKNKTISTPSESKSREPAAESWSSILRDMPPFLDWALVISLIFGGCCSNVFALESIVKYEADSGLIITFIQFVFTTAITAWSQRAISPQFPWVIRKPKVPILAWALSAVLFWIVNMMNNWAFNFNISVPVHIILRSGGSITTILIGSIWGNRYSQGQILGVVLLTFGVVTAALADAKSKAKGISPTAKNTDATSFLQGLLILFVAQVISAIMGLYTQHIYTKYGPHWEENLLWSHLFSLTFFATVIPQIQVQFNKLQNSPPLFSVVTGVSKHSRIVEIPQQTFYLLLNSLTQFFCIQGVNRLAARSTALGVTVALNLRKLVSLLLSICLFGNSLTTGVWVGAGFVFAGGAVYAGWDSWKARSANSELEKKTQ